MKAINIHSLLALTEQQQQIKLQLHEAKESRNSIVAQMAALDQQKQHLAMQVRTIDKQIQSLHAQYISAENKSYEIYE